MAKRTGLGRGIGALIPTADQGESRPVDVFFPEAPPAEDLVTVPGARLIHIDPNTIVPNPRQPRTNFDPDELAELVHSVREFGVLQPVVVRDRGDGTTHHSPSQCRDDATLPFAVAGRCDSPRRGDGTLRHSTSR